MQPEKDAPQVLVSDKLKHRRAVQALEVLTGVTVALDCRKPQMVHARMVSKNRTSIRLGPFTRAHQAVALNWLRTLEEAAEVLFGSRPQTQYP